MPLSKRSLRLFALVMLFNLLLVGGLGTLAYVRLQRDIDAQARTTGAIALRTASALLGANQRHYQQALLQIAASTTLLRYLRDPHPRNLSQLMHEWQLLLGGYLSFSRLQLSDSQGQISLTATFEAEPRQVLVAATAEDCPACRSLITAIAGQQQTLYFPPPQLLPDEQQRPYLRWQAVAAVADAGTSPHYLLAELGLTTLMRDMWQGELLGQLLLLDSDGQVLAGLDSDALFTPDTAADPVVIQLQQRLEPVAGGSPLQLRWQLTSGQRWVLLKQRLQAYLWPLLVLAGLLLALSPLLASWWQGRQQRRRQEALSLAAMDSMAALVIMDSQWRVVEVNAAFTTITGFSAEAIVGQPLVQLLAAGHPPLAQISAALTVAGRWQGELICLRANGDSYPQLSEFSPLFEGGKLRYIVANFLDLSEQKRLERQLRELSLRDPLTNAWNRRKLNEVVDAEIARQERHHQPFALAVIDLDHFKQINDNHGHDVGDEVLRRAVNLFSHCLRRSDLLARIGGEEFVAFLPQTEREGAHKVLERLRLALAESEEQPLVTCSIGLACYHPGDSRKTLQRRADEALYLAKANGRNRLVFADAG